MDYEQSRGQKYASETVLQKVLHTLNKSGHKTSSVLVKLTQHINRYKLKYTFLTNVTLHKNYQKFTRS